MLLFLRGCIAAALLVAASAVSAADGVDRLPYFVTFGRADDVQLVLQKGADPNARDAQGWPLLAVAAGRHDAEGPRIVQLLTEAGADVNATDEGKHYPLLVAIRNGNAPVVQYLLSKGASINITTKEGVSAVSEAQRSANPQVQQLVLQAATELAERERYARSPARRYELLREYARAHCGYYYWSYYISSKQDDDEPHRLAAQASQQALAQRMGSYNEELQRNFKMNMSELKSRMGELQVLLRKNLDALVSNRNRRAKGVGTQADLDTRCNKIVTQLYPDAPAPVTPAPVPNASSTPAAGLPPATAQPAPVAPAP